MKNWLYFILFIIVSATSCRQAYLPPAITVKNNFLVVEGSINGGADASTIKLSRTANVQGKAANKPELGAIINIEDDQSNSYPLYETGGGEYHYAGLYLDHARKFRIHIKTTNGEEYVSDFVPVLDSPPIDSVSFDTRGNAISGPGLNIYVSTHDATNAVKYYRWDYQETWQFHSNFHSYFYSNGDTVLTRDLFNDNITNCWQSDTSSTIVLASSAALSRNVIANAPVTYVVSSAEKIGTKYSIQVRQYALTADAYKFYSVLKKNTEQLGGIFDAQPSSLNGNIHCINNPSEPVLGYITAGVISTKRIFITSRQLPNWSTTPFYSDCKLEFDWDAKPPQPCCYYNFGGINQVDAYINWLKSNNPAPFIPVDALGRPGSPPIGYTASTKECVDCTLRGTNVAPAFWQ